MRIEEINNSTVLETGQQLVVLRCSKFYGSAAFSQLQQSNRTGVVQYFRHREEPVPWVSRGKNGRLFRRTRTTNERKLTSATRRQKKSSNLKASPSNFGKNEVRIRCRALGIISLARISEAGRSIVAPNTRTQTISTAGFTALRSGIRETAC